MRIHRLRLGRRIVAGKPVPDCAGTRSWEFDTSGGACSIVAGRLVSSGLLFSFIWHPPRSIRLQPGKGDDHPFIRIHLVGRLIARLTGRN
jgi:hypothetical protein